MPLRRILASSVPLVVAAIMLIVIAATGTPPPTSAAAPVEAAPVEAVLSKQLANVAHIQAPTLALPEAPPEVAAAPEEPTAVSTPSTPSWWIDVTAVGLQAELDACQWVRMDFSIPTPIVAAHNYCGGGIALEMQVGDTVTMAGAGLDGVYQVVGSKDASANQYADEAIAGLGGDVILQTCYWSDNGTVILVGLQRIG